ncbi:uncharacterized protein TNCV_1289811 [Trichonephila clavipes]|nr:uncharacterized protein TNCV_1289811 [Trichonephila clavipes]
MDVCKCIAPLQHGRTLNSRRAASALVTLVEGKRSERSLAPPNGLLPYNWGGAEQNRTITCLVLKAKANDMCKILALNRNEFY